MKRSCYFAAVALLVAFSLAMTNPPANAGRMGGATSTTGTVPATYSVYYDITFNQGEPAVVTVNGDGRSILYLMIYDSDGHVSIGTGNFFSKTASMNVYRTGVFRVEVRNAGLSDTNFTLTTN